MIDLNQCKPGDKLLLENGGIATYRGPLDFDNHGFHHIMVYPNGIPDAMSCRGVSFHGVVVVEILGQEGAT